MNHDILIKQQSAYYQARAGEYDEWFYRRGRYDRGIENNRRWFNEIEVIKSELASFKPTGQVLDLACGTGIWTEQLLLSADKITAVDASAEVLEINQLRNPSSKVRFEQADIFAWQPDQKYDVIFFSFWLSHVPPERFAAFWSLIARALKPQGRFFLIDSKYEKTSTARDHQLPEKESTVVTRRLNDGREFEIVKVFYQAGDLAERLKEMGWDCTVKETENYFLYGWGSRQPQKSP